MPRRRLRARLNWAMRWGGALACLAVLFAYVIGLFAVARVSYRRGIDLISVELVRGQMRLTSTDWFVSGGGGQSHPVPDGLKLDLVRVNDTSGYRFLPTWGEALRPRLVWHSGASPFEEECEARIPLWWMFVVAAIASAFAVRSHRQRERAPRACPSCSYDLSGLPSGSPCPECAAHT